MTHVDGRAKLAALASPLFARMPDGVYRELLLDQLAAQIRMPAAKLKDHMQAAAAPAARRAQVPERAEPISRMRSRISVGRGNLLSQAISLVLHHPAAASAVAREALAGVDLPGMAVLHELVEQAAGMKQPSTAMLLERWRDRPEHARLTELAMAPSMVSDDKGAAQELNMAVQKLVDNHGPGRRLNELLRKAAEMDLNFDEKTELSLLLKAKDRPGGPA